MTASRPTGPADSSNEEMSVGQRERLVRPRQRRRRFKGHPTVWVAGRSESSVIALFADRGSAMRWLLVQHEAEVREAARTEEYLRRDYTDRAAREVDPAMRAYYLAAIEEREKVGAIEDQGSYGAAFSASSYERVFIHEQAIEVYEPVAPEGES